MERKKPILQVRFFRATNGREPVREFLKSLPKADRIKAGVALKELQFGWPLGMPLVRKLHEDLWELRCQLSDVTARLLFTVFGDTMIVLHAFIKKTQKLPGKELKVAQQRFDQIKRGFHEE